MSAQAGSYVRIFDTTLRDGEQSPGATMAAAEKLEVARVLGRLGVDVIEAGFPAASPDDLAAVQRIAEEIGANEDSGATPSGRPPSICGLARTHKRDIEKAWEAVRPAATPRIHTFLATSDIHLEHKLKMSRKDVVACVGEMVAHAAGLCGDVEFSPEDAGRSDPEFLYEVLATAIEAGARTLNIPDTVGYTVPEEFGRLIAGIGENVPGIDKAVISVHCHNDLGLATANSLSGVQNGARQVEVAVNGIGERAGNTALEEIVMILATRRPFLGYETGVDPTHITRASRLVSSCTGMFVQPNKAVVGANAFSHEAGIHQDGLLKNQETYEIMRPESVGANQTRLVLGKHSGRHAVKVRLSALGYDLSDEELGQAFERFKELADKKKTITDADLEALVADELYQPREIFAVESVQVACGTLGMATATVRLRGPDGESHTRAAVGEGPVDAAFKAVDSIVEAESRLLEFAVQAVTEGIDALGQVSVRVQGTGEVLTLNPQHDGSGPRTFGGHGADVDIVVASVKAYLAALNRLRVAEDKAREDSPTAAEAVRH